MTQSNQAVTVVTTPAYDNDYQAGMTDNKGNKLGFFNLVVESRNEDAAENTAETHNIKQRMNDFSKTVKHLNAKCSTLHIGTVSETGTVLMFSDNNELLAFVNNCEDTDKLSKKLAKGKVLFTQTNKPIPVASASALF